MRRAALLLVAVVLVVSAAAYVASGRLPGPTLSIASPGDWVGASTPLQIEVDSPSGLEALEVAIEQNDARLEVASLAGAAAGAPQIARRDQGSRTLLEGELGAALPGLRSGPARLVVTATRPVLFGLRRASAVATRDLEVRLERPRIAALSSHNFVSQGGAEMVVYRVTPGDVASGVRVGEREYPGFPGTGVTAEGVAIADPAVRVAFFALAWDQPLDTPIRLFARDPAGNGASAAFDHRTFPKPARASRIDLDDAFLERVVPVILEGTTEIRPEGSLLDRFLAINGELRRRNNATIAALATQTSPQLLFGAEVFHPFTNTAVQSAFADQRTYWYQGREVDRQVHLGFDLASYVATPIVAAARGVVLHADELGIYGNCVVLDHGMGVQSLYAHLSTLEAEPGQTVERGERLGLSGVTGLAGGDHLHFTMLVSGQMVNPIEWWDPHWIEDRIVRKLRAVSTPS